MTASPKPWRVEQLKGTPASSARSVEVQATSWESALRMAWGEWLETGSFDNVSVEVGEAETRVVDGATGRRYRIVVVTEAEKSEASGPAPVAEKTDSGEPPPAAHELDASKPALAAGESAAVPKPGNARKAEASLSKRTVKLALPRAEASPQPRPALSTKSTSLLLTPATKVATQSTAVMRPATKTDAAAAPSGDQRPSGETAAVKRPSGETAAVSRRMPEIPAARLRTLIAAATQLFTRSKDPSEGIPVVYRQYGYALPIGTEEPEAEAFAHWVLERLKGEVDGSAAPRLFHLAIYDEMFTGEPTVAAVCKLEWKEWKNQVKVSFPRRGDDTFDTSPPRSRTSSMYPEGIQHSGLPGAFAAPPPVERPPPARLPTDLGALFLGPATPPRRSEPPPRNDQS